MNSTSAPYFEASPELPSELFSTDEPIKISDAPEFGQNLFQEDNLLHSFSQEKADKSVPQPMITHLQNNLWKYYYYMQQQIRYRAQLMKYVQTIQSSFSERPKMPKMEVNTHKLMWDNLLAEDKDVSPTGSDDTCASSNMVEASSNLTDDSKRSVGSTADEILSISSWEKYAARSTKLPHPLNTGADFNEKEIKTSHEIQRCSSQQARNEMIDNDKKDIDDSIKFIRTRGYQNLISYQREVAKLSKFSKDIHKTEKKQVQLNPAKKISFTRKRKSVCVRKNNMRTQCIPPPKVPQKNFIYDFFNAYLKKLVENIENSKESILTKEVCKNDGEIVAWKRNLQKKNKTIRSLININRFLYADSAEYKSDPTKPDVDDRKTEFARDFALKFLEEEGVKWILTSGVKHKEDYLKIRVLVLEQMKQKHEIQALRSCFT
jgi:hypothetical protein